LRQSAILKEKHPGKCKKLSECMLVPWHSSRYNNNLYMIVCIQDMDLSHFEKVNPMERESGIGGGNSIATYWLSYDRST